jgi:hypothetical protein
LKISIVSRIKNRIALAHPLGGLVFRPLTPFLQCASRGSLSSIIGRPWPLRSFAQHTVADQAIMMQSAMGTLHAQRQRPHTPRVFGIDLNPAFDGPVRVSPLKRQPPARAARRQGYGSFCGHSSVSGTPQHVQPPRPGRFCVPQGRASLKCARRPCGGTSRLPPFPTLRPSSMVYFRPRRAPDESRHGIRRWQNGGGP